MRRYAGLMFAIERTTLRLLGEHLKSNPRGVYGYELAELLHQEASTSLAETMKGLNAKSLRANGSVYKLLYRLSRIGAVTSHWEEAEVALAEGRPRRRYYVLTDNGCKRAANLEKSVPAPTAARPAGNRSTARRVGPVNSHRAVNRDPCARRPGRALIDCGGCRFREPWCSRGAPPLPVCILVPVQALVLALVLLSLAGCASSPEADARDRSSELPARTR